MMIRKFTADSYYEAFVMAQNELGKDMVVVTTRTIQKKSMLGIYTKEQIELTAAAPRARDEAREKILPAKPMPTEEISSHPQIPRSLAGNLPRRASGPDLPGQTQALDPRPKPFAPPKSSPLPASSRPHPMIPNDPPVDKAAFQLHQAAAQATGTGLRASHGMRPNQEMDQEPTPRKVEDEAKRTRKLQTFLDQIIRQKEETVDLPLPVLPRKPAKSNPPASAPPPQADEQAFEDIRNQISELTKVLQSFQQTSRSAMETSGEGFPAGLNQIKSNLIAMETPCDVLQEIMTSLAEEIPARAQQTYASSRLHAIEWLKSRIKVHCDRSDSPVTTPREILVLLGPTGVGKTTTIAKLAASFALNVVERKSVALLTLDTFRIGAPSQLSQYAQIIEAGMEIILEPKDIPEALDRHEDKEIILVDTAGRCQKNKSELQELKEFLAVLPYSRRYLVLSAVTKFSDMMDTYKRFSSVGFDQLIFTKIDETNSLGPILGVLVKTGIPLAYLTHGQTVPDDFRQGNLEFIVAQMLPEDS
jgi:flagellar biosynthesis protein FlhF